MCLGNNNYEKKIKTEDLSYRAELNPRPWDFLRGMKLVIVTQWVRAYQLKSHLTKVEPTGQ